MGLDQAFIIVDRKEPHDTVGCGLHIARALGNALGVAGAGLAALECLQHLFLAGCGQTRQLDPPGTQDEDPAAGIAGEEDHIIFLEGFLDHGRLDVLKLFGRESLEQRNVAEFKTISIYI